MDSSGMDYSIHLMRIIEAICHGTPLRYDSSHLWHHQMASEYIRKALSGTPSEEALAKVIALGEELAIVQDQLYQAQNKVADLIAEREALTVMSQMKSEGKS